MDCGVLSTCFGGKAVAFSSHKKPAGSGPLKKRNQMKN
jgi:hypothetical protein